MAKIRMALWALVVLVGISATVMYFVRPPERPVGLFGGAFTLESTQGGTFTEADLIGTPSIIFFGYTFCPDVCPTTLAESAGWRAALNLSTDQLRTIFVTVDPERDTIESLKTYLSAFDNYTIGLRGDAEQTEAAKKAFGVFSQKNESADSTEYLVDHTASVFLINAKGNFEGTISFGESQATAIEKIKNLLAAD